MKSRLLLRAACSVVLCLAGFFVAWLPGTHFRQTTVIVDAGGCRMVTDVIDTGDDAQGSVLVFHGLAANKKIMSYLARAFALEHLRVFVPDLPGHGRTPGPFNFARAAACSDTFLHQLIARGVIDPQRTVIMGHSMGGAIAVIVGTRTQVAGVIALSPAPMSPSRGIPAFMLPFDGAPPTPNNTLAISGQWEPGRIRETAQDLIDAAPDHSGKFLLVPHSSHVSVLFDSRVARASQEWAKQALHLSEEPATPSPRYLLGWAAGFAGLLLLTGPFIRETLGPLLIAKSGTRGSSIPEPVAPQGTDSTTPVALARAVMEVAALSIAAVVLFHFIPPIPGIHLFQGDYFGSLLLLIGAGILIFHRDDLSAQRDGLRPITLLTASIAALMLHFLIMGWFELTASETWLTASRWLRFPLIFAVVLPYHIAEELLLGPTSARPAWRRLTYGPLLRLVAWGALVAAVFALQSGQIFTILLAPYFALFCLLQRMGMQVVRKETSSALPAALFGAILLAGFCVVVFPIN
jgi:pimeloyl-ACP methyl ester carboxylesterase